MSSPYLIVCCANAPDVLASNLLASPDVQSGALPIRVLRDAPSAASAYAAVIDERAATIILFIHQDAYLPRGFKACLDSTVNRLDQMSPEWGVLGVYGATGGGDHVGYIYDGSNGRILGHPVAEPIEVAVLDEVLIGVRVASGVTFDPRLPSFHLYGTQIALDAQRKNRGVFVGDLRIIHNSRSILALGADYESAWLYLANAWKAHLPQPNLCCGRTTRSRWPLWRWRLRNAIKLKTGRRKIHTRSAGGRDIAQSIGFE